MYSELRDSVARETFWPGSAELFAVPQHDQLWGFLFVAVQCILCRCGWWVLGRNYLPAGDVIFAGVIAHITVQVTGDIGYSNLTANLAAAVIR